MGRPKLLKVMWKSVNETAKSRGACLVVVLVDVALVTHRELALQTSSERGRGSPEARERS